MRFSLPVSRIATFACILIAVSSLGWCIYRDIQIEKFYPGDIRNRVTGSRLQMAGISPYFYHSKPGESTWFYDPQNYYRREYSSVTATPFFHQILSPIALLPQRTISRLLLALDYLMALLMGFMALRMKPSTIKQKWAVGVIVLFLLHTYAWTQHVYCGQTYLFIPFLAFLHFYILSRKPAIVNGILAGIVAISLILIRPPAVLYLLPLIFLTKSYPRRFLWSYIISGACLLLIAFASPQSRHYWSDYGKLVKMFAYRTGKARAVKEIPEMPNNLEGFDFKKVMEHARHFSYHSHDENGNLMVISYHFFHYKVTPEMLSTGLFITIALFFWILFRRRVKSKKPTLFWLTLAGFCFYMIAEFFSPVYRHSYNTIQWIFPLILLAGYYTPGYGKVFIIAILTGIFLNAWIFRFMQMQSTIGEYLICASILGIIFNSKKAVLYNESQRSIATRT